MSLSERLKELKGARTLIRRPQLPLSLKIERSYNQVSQKYDQITPVRKVDYDALVTKLRLVAKSRAMGTLEDQKSFIDQSARLTETFLILDEIAAQKEKALIFLESLDLQEHLALMIKTRYGLKRRPMQINGEVAGEKRQALVDQFQAQRGSFDVMILS